MVTFSLIITVFTVEIKSAIVLYSGDVHVDGRSGSKEPQPLSPLSLYTFTKAEVHSMSAEEADPFEEHQEDEKSELSFASAFASPTHSTQSLSSLQYTETTV